MKLRYFIFAILSVCTLHCIYAETADTKPNIIVILADDLGYSDVGFNRKADFPTELGEIPTPNLDALASRGIICSNAHVSHPFCGPSRVSIMTGMSPHRIGAQYNLPNDITTTLGVAEDETYWSSVIDDQGYNTMALGKWHLGFVEGKYQPMDRGFDEFFGFCGGGKNYFRSEYDATWYELNDETQSDDPAVYNVGNGTTNEYSDPLQRNRDYVDRKEYALDDYLTDILTDNAIKFIDDKASDSEPLMIYLAYNAPHTPLQAPQDEIDAFQLANPDFEEEYRNSNYLLNSTQVTKYTDPVEKEKKIDYYVQNRVTYATMVTNMDNNIGRVVQKLKDEGIYDNTIIVFFSDNGGYTYSKGAVNYPLDALKGSVDEGGHRVPFFVHWPDQITQPSVYPYQVSSMDLYPSLIALAGGTIPTDKVLDGVDIIDDMIAGTNTRVDDPIFVMRPQNGFHNTAVISYPYRMTRKGSNGHWTLYDVNTNPQVPLSTLNDGSSVDSKIDELKALGGAWSEEFVSVKPAWFDNEGTNGEGHPHRLHWFGEDLIGNNGAMIMPDYEKVFAYSMTIPVVSATGVILSSDTVEIRANESIHIEKHVLPLEATDKTVIWSSSNANVAYVNADHEVIGVAPGTATVYVTSNDGAFVDSSHVIVAEAIDSRPVGELAEDIPGGFAFNFESDEVWTAQSTYHIIAAVKPYAGAQSVKMSWEGIPTAQKHLSSPAGEMSDMVAGTYDLKMWIYKEATTTTRLLHFAIVGGDGGQLEIDITDVPNEIWTQVSYMYATTTDFDSESIIKFRSKYQIQDIGEGIVYIDNMTMTPTVASSVVEVEDFDCCLYPNPAENIITVSSPKASNIDIYNTMGTKVRSEVKSSEPFSINVENIDRGIYFFQISSEDNKQTKLVTIH